MEFIYSYSRLNQFTVSLWFKPDGTGNQQGLLSNGWECEQDVPEEASIQILYGTSGVSASIQTKPTTGGSVIEDTVGGVMVNIYFNITEYSFIHLIISTNHKKRITIVYAIKTLNISIYLIY